MPEQEENPCRTCAWCLEKELHFWYLRIDACIQPDRLKETGADYRATNHEGPKCRWYDKGKQTQLGDF